MEDERFYFLTITPTNMSGVGDPACVLTVSARVTVLDEPIEALHANDEEALQRARADVARRLNVPIDNISY